MASGEAQLGGLHGALRSPPGGARARPAASAASRASGSRWAARQCAAATTGTSSHAAARAVRCASLGRDSVTTARADQLVADPEPLVGLGAHEAVLQRLSRAAARSPSRPPAPRRGSDVDLGGSPRVNWASSRRPPGRGGRGPWPLRRRQQSQHAAAFGRPAGEAGHNEVGERTRQRRALELAARATQLPTTSGGPAERSATRTTIEADGRSRRSPRSARRSRRARGREVHPDGRRRPASMTARFSRSGSPGRRSGW